MRWFPSYAVNATKAGFLDIVLYTPEQMGNEATAMRKPPPEDMDTTLFYVVKVKPQDQPDEQYMEVSCVHRNAAGMQFGGSGVPVDPEYLSAAESFWENRAVVRHVKPVKPKKLSKEADLQGKSLKCKEFNEEQLEAFVATRGKPGAPEDLHITTTDMNKIDRRSLLSHANSLDLTTFFGKKTMVMRHKPAPVSECGVGLSDLSWRTLSFF